ncbi:MAG: sigma-70 family RNA polymerase sigma factor [Clostridia bacterium]|nr:sigma-70 family RNA polymerase sigma factor [Clostridia bacterium]
MQDYQIIELYQARDERAIAKTAEKYGSYCLSIAQNILQNMQDSEECVNDTWLQTWNSIPPACPNVLKTYVGRITRNLSINRYKAKKRDKRGGGEVVLALDELTDVASPEQSVQQYMDKQEFAEAFNRFLRTLPERECNIFIRRYYHVDSVESIAKRYGISKANVFKILSRTRQMLKTFLESEGFAL